MTDDTIAKKLQDAAREKSYSTISGESYLCINRADIEHETEGTVDEWGKVGVGRPWNNQRVKVIVMMD